MQALERLQHQSHARTRLFARKVEEARRIIDEAMQTGARFYQGYSSGSDSLVVLDMLSQAGYSIDARWSDDGFDFPATLTFLSETETRYHFRLHRTRNMHSWRLWCVEMGRPDLCDDPAALAAWGNPHVWNDTRTEATHQEYHDYGGVFLGLLASESAARRYVLHGGSRALYRVKSEGGMWHCSPLASWTKSEVWAYLISRGVPYNPVYDALAELGVPLEQRRVAPATCYRVLQFGSGSLFKQLDISLYNKMAALFPHMRVYN